MRLDDAADMVLVLSTWPADEDAGPLARTLVEEGLAACVSVLEPMRSVYLWQGALEETRERQLVMKAPARKADALAARLDALHPYDVPEILVLPVARAGTAYLAWLASN